MAAAAAALAMGVEREARRRRAAVLRGRAAPARAGRRGGGCALRQRLEGDQRRRGARGASLAFDGGVHAICGGSSKGEGFEALAEPVGRALRRLLSDRRDRGPARGRARAGLGRGGRPRALRRACGGGQRGGRERAAGRGGAAGARLRQLRRLPRLRRARRPLQGAGRRALSARGAKCGLARLRGPCGGAKCALMCSLRLAAIGPRRKAGAQPVEHSLLLTATLCLLAFGVGDGLQRQLDDVAARARPATAPSTSSARCCSASLGPGRDADPGDPRRPDRPRADPGAPRRLVRPAGGGADARGRRRGQRGPALDRRRHLPGPAIGDREARAGPARRQPARRRGRR